MSKKEAGTEKFSIYTRRQYSLGHIEDGLKSKTHESIQLREPKHVYVWRPRPCQNVSHYRIQLIDTQTGH